MKLTTFDIETTGLNQFTDKIFSYCIGDIDGEVNVYRITNFEKLQKYFNDVSLVKIAHNFKFELSFLRTHNIKVPKNTIWHCTLIMSQILNNLAPSHKLEDLCSELDDEYDKSLSQKVKLQASARGGRFDKVNKRLFKQYQIKDGQDPMLLFEVFYPEIKENYYKEYRTEIEFAKVCIKMEEEGISVDIEKIEKLIDYLEEEINKIHEKVYDILGEFINIKSDAKVKKLLYKTLKLPVSAYTDKGFPSVDKNAIFDLIEKFPEYKPVLDLILKIRSYTTGKSIALSYLDYKDSSNIIHPRINPNVARTGRPSCSKPNLLNVAKEDVIKNPFPVPARKCFRCKDGYVLYFADYSGLQMRLIADSCGEQEMIDIINVNGDVHKIPTELFYSGLKKPIVKKELLSKKDWNTYRNAGKNTNFAMPFGAGASGASKTLKLPYAIAEIGVEAYCQRFPKVAYYSKFQIEQVKRFGYVLTPFGRKLYVRKDKPYIGANYYIQGTEAGIMKRAIIKVNKYFEKEYKRKISLVLDIYDEIIFSCTIELVKYEKEILNTVSKLMTDIEEIDIRLDVEWKKSEGTWYDAKEIKV